jgi:hypothetical protein
MRFIGFKTRELFKLNLAKSEGELIFAKAISVPSVLGICK